MKKSMLLTVCLFVILCVKAQDVLQFGQIQYDGYWHSIEGALWKKHPEAKMVYEGIVPPGVIVITLAEDYFIRFAPGEHNSLDRNYIVIPKGEKIYYLNGEYRAARCANKIIYFKKVNDVKVIYEKKIEEKKPEEGSYKPLPFAGMIEQHRYEPEPIKLPQVIQQKNWFGRNWGWFAVGVPLGAGAVYLATRGGKGGNSSPQKPRGGPGGVPVTP